MACLFISAVFIVACSLGVQLKIYNETHEFGINNVSFDYNRLISILINFQ